MIKNKAMHWEKEAVYVLGSEWIENNIVKVLNSVILAESIMLELSSDLAWLLAKYLIS